MVKFLIIWCAALLMANAVSAQSVEQLYVQTDKDSYHAGEIIWFRIDNTDAVSGRPISVSKIVYAELLNASNLPVLQGKVAMENTYGAGSFFLSPGTASGRYILRAYTNHMKNFGTGAFFEKVIDIYNIKSEGAQAQLEPRNTKGFSKQNLKLEIRADKAIYNARQKIRLNIASEAPASLSVSVYRVDSLSDIATRNDSYANGKNVPSTGEFIPEFNGHIITGKIIHQKTGQPGAGIAAYLFVPGLKYLFTPAVSDANGHIEFEVKQFYGVNEIMVQADSNYRFEISNPFSTSYTQQPANLSAIPASYSTTLLDESVNAQVQLIYNGNKQNEFVVPPIDSMPFYGKPDVVYESGDYVKFETMEEVLREYVTPVGVLKRNGKLFPFIYDDLRRRPFHNNPLVLVDGIPLVDMEKFMAIDPSIISRINIVNRRFYSGRNVFEGIVDIDTKVNYIDTLELDKNVSILNYDGLQLKRKFYSPVYESEAQRSSRLPDFRNVLFWSPDINTGSAGNASVEFYSSDLKGKFVIVVHGITPDGRMGDKNSFIEVQ